jgi:hypothetical protein
MISLFQAKCQRCYYGVVEGPPRDHQVACSQPGLGSPSNHPSGSLATSNRTVHSSTPISVALYCLSAEGPTSSIADNEQMAKRELKLV